MSAATPSLDELKYIHMTAMVNRIKSPRRFLQKLMFDGKHQSINTEHVEIDQLIGARQTAPFVRKNGEAIMVGGYTSKKSVVEAPNIRIKRPFEPSQLLFGRKPGAGIWVSADEQISALDQHIARDLQRMADMCSNTEEWMAAQILTGTIFYSVSDQETYTITFPKPAGNTVDVSAAAPWTNQTTSEPEEDFHAAKSVVSEEESVTIDVAVFGLEAAKAFRKNAKVRDLLQTPGMITTGNLDFTRQFTEDGAIFIGNYCGIACWEYSPTISVEGVTTSLIRPKWVEFIATGASAEWIQYYAAIPDMEALEGGSWIGERFSKSWLEKDPSAMWALLHSRPLPVMRRPGAVYSLKVIAG